MRDQSLICWFTARIFQVVNRSLLQKFRHIWLILLKTEWPGPATTGDVASAACRHPGLHCWSCDGRTELTHRVSAVSGAELRATACSLSWNCKGSFGSCFTVPWTRPQLLRLLLCQLKSSELMEMGLWLENSCLGYSQFSKFNFRWIWRGEHIANVHTTAYPLCCMYQHTFACTLQMLIELKRFFN